MSQLLSYQLTEELFHQGLDLDTKARQALLYPYRENQPELCLFVEELWIGSEREDLPSAEQVSHASWLALGQQAIECRNWDNFILEELVASGPMSFVYKALQKKPQRPVAIKIFPGFESSPQLFWRFRAEQEALALMAHPNVATMLESGETPEGRPFFSMAWLDGKPVTAFCDHMQMPIKERISCFIKICAGVSHAHFKGVIHRDLKPDNILIVDVDGLPEPKIIDFGIASFLYQQGNTEVDTIMGTRAYLSPEAASGNTTAIEARSDVYALGILLCQLLIGVTPFAEAMEKCSLLDWCLLVREKEVPSLDSILPDGEPGEAVAQSRSCSISELRKTVQGELNWITAKATAKAISERYASVSALAEDLLCYLDGKPVSVGPPGWMYRTMKMVRRHRWKVAGIAFFIAFLMVGMIAVSASLIQVRRSERRLSAIDNFNRGIFDKAHPNRGGANVRAVDLLRAAEDNIPRNYQHFPDLEIAIRLTVARSYQGLGFTERARVNFERALVLSSNNLEDTLAAIEGVAYACADQKKYTQAMALYERGLRLAKVTLGDTDPQTLRLASGFALVLGDHGERKRARELFEHTLAIQQKNQKPAAISTMATRINFARFLLQTHEFERARELMQTNLRVAEDSSMGDHPILFSSQHYLAQALVQQGNRKEGEALYSNLLDKQRQILGIYHQDALATFSDLIQLMSEAGNLSEVLCLMGEVIDQWPSTIDKQTPTYLLLRHNQAEYLMNERDYAQSERILTEVLKNKRIVLGEFHKSTLITEWTLGETLQLQGDLDGAELLFQGVVAKADAFLGEDDHYRPMFHKLMDDFLKKKIVPPP